MTQCLSSGFDLLVSLARSSAQKKPNHRLTFTLITYGSQAFLRLRIRDFLPLPHDRFVFTFIVSAALNMKQQRYQAKNERAMARYK